MRAYRGPIEEARAKHREVMTRYAARQHEINPERWQAQTKAWRRTWRVANVEANRAHGAVYQAIRAGRLIRPDRCQRCGKECKPEASHDDYSLRLSVEWLCRRCHAMKDMGRYER